MAEYVQVLEGIPDCGGTGVCGGTCTRCLMAKELGGRVQAHLAGGGPFPGPGGIYAQPSRYSARLAGGDELGAMDTRTKVGLVAIAGLAAWWYSIRRDRRVRRRGTAYVGRAMQARRLATLSAPGGRRYAI